jgi:hypothetical protein
MAGKRAKILSKADVGELLVYASCTRHPLRNTVMVLLSAKAGLRAGEIANLTWAMLVDATGQVSGLVVWFDRAFKNICLKGCFSHSGRRTFVTGPLVSSTRQAARYGTCSCRQGTGQYRQRSGTSTATPMLSANSLR